MFLMPLVKIIISWQNNNLMAKIEWLNRIFLKFYSSLNKGLKIAVSVYIFLCVFDLPNQRVIYLVNLLKYIIIPY